jgi:hypothetical protein
MKYGHLKFHARLVSAKKVFLILLRLIVLSKTAQVNIFDHIPSNIFFTIFPFLIKIKIFLTLKTGYCWVWGIWEI